MVVMKLDEIDKPLKIDGLRRKAYVSASSYGCKVKNIDATVGFIFVAYCRGNELMMAEFRVLDSSNPSGAKNNHPIDPTWLKNLLKNCDLPTIEIVDIEGRTFLNPSKPSPVKVYPPPVGERAIYHYLTYPLLLKHGHKIGVAWTFKDRGIKTMYEAQEVLDGLVKVKKFFAEMEQTHNIQELISTDKERISQFMEQIKNKEYEMRRCHEEHSKAKEKLERLGIKYMK